MIRPKYGHYLNMAFSRCQMQWGIIHPGTDIDIGSLFDEALGLCHIPQIGGHPQRLDHSGTDEILHNWPVVRPHGKLGGRPAIPGQLIDKGTAANKDPHHLFMATLSRQMQRCTAPVVSCAYVSTMSDERLHLLQTAPLRRPMQVGRQITMFLFAPPSNKGNGQNPANQPSCTPRPPLLGVPRLRGPRPPEGGTPNVSTSHH